MRRSVVFVTVLLAALVSLPVAAQSVRTIAVADFVDESMDGALVVAPRLNAALVQLLKGRAADRFKVVAAEEVRAAMRAQGVTPRDLVSPARAAEVAKAVGADWIVTGRWTHLDVDPFTLRSPSDPNREVVVYLAGQGVIEIRVLDATSRKAILQDTFFGEARGASPLGVLWHAAETALRRAAERIVQL